MPVQILLIRHGATKGNKEHRYVGSTDEPLLPESAEKLRKMRVAWLQHMRAKAEEKPEESRTSGNAEKPRKAFSAGNGKDKEEGAALRLYTSPLLRAKQTAAILFPGVTADTVPDFRECDFGEFEYRNYQELDGNADYQEYIDSGGTSGFPGGETLAEFQNRTVNAFLALPEIRQSTSEVTGESILSKRPGQAGVQETVAIVAHGGTIMALLDAFSEPHADYFFWQVKNGEGYSCVWDPGSRKLIEIEKVQELR